MDCDTAILVLAAREQRALSSDERAALRDHVEHCEDCRALATGSAPTLTHRDDPAVDATVEVGSEDAPPAPRTSIARLATSEVVRGETIGRFLVIEVLGAGGMGVVYSAYDPYLDRKVAIKVLRSSARSDDGHTRLMREAQAMARIKHPSVITVHEVGMFRSQVYVAMEFADGGTLRAWFQRARHARRDILDVFAKAGRGLAAAHAAGLVHRDFKPDNVLMTKDGNVLVTDFGLVATLAGDSLAGPAPDDAPPRTTPLSEQLTRTGAVIGTPAYMAPEQFESKPTAKSDQFAFCVALYEALYGVRPFRGATYLELQSSIVLGALEPPPKDADVPSWLRRVVVRGLAVDPDARFASMTELLDELARVPRRRRRRVLAGAAALAVAGAAIALTMRAGSSETCGGGQARVAEAWSPSRRARLEAAFAASKRPHAPASLAKTTALVDDWSRGWIDGYVGACRATRVRGEQSEALLDRRMRCLGRRLDDARATIDALIGGGEDAVDRAVDAASALPTLAPCADADALLADVAPPDTPVVGARVATVRAQLDAARGESKLGHYAKALAIGKPALADARTIGYGPAVAEALVVVGLLEHELRDREAASSLDEALRVAAAAGDDRGVVDAAAWLVITLANESARYDAAGEIASFAGGVAQHVHAGESAIRLDYATSVALSMRGKPDDARVRGEHALTSAEKELGPDHPLALAIVEQLGNIAQSQGRFADARKLFERVVASRERVFGKDHPVYAFALNRLAEEYIHEDKLADAQKLYERALAIRRATFGDAHPEVASSLNGLGVFYAQRHDMAKARGYFEQALAIWEKAGGPDSIDIASPLMNLGLIYEDADDMASARKAFERGLAILERAFGPDHPNLTGALNNLGNVAKNEHKFDEALALYRRKLRIVERVYGPDHPSAADTLANMAIVLRMENKLDEAEDMTTRALHATEKAYGPDHTRTGLNLSNLGGVQTERGRYADALASYHRSRVILETKLGPEHPHVATVLQFEGSTLVELKRPAEAVPLLERALAIRVARKMGPGELGAARFWLAQALAADPKQRARGRAEAATARGEFAAAKDKDEVAKVDAWLRKH